MRENDNKSEQDVHPIGYPYSPDISISTLKRIEETDSQ
jgi:hypothetical protein